MVETLGGSIWVDSTPGKGTIFRFTLPIEDPSNGTYDLEYKDEAVAQPASMIDFEENVIRTNKPLLLICEDNPTILSYLEIFLQSSFDILKARHGEEGLKLAIKSLPDLILTDINMPEMDGIEMTKEVKSHALTSHIPVIMLTGKTEVEDKILGKESGADAYIGKPFHYRELLLTLQNQYSLQQKWKEKYSSQVQQMIDQYGELNPIGANDIKIQNVLEVDGSTLFLSTLMEVFENNYNTEQFDTVQLCRTLLISRTQLYRKLAAITDESPMEMLRNFRLKKAAELLISHPELSIQDVTSKVGFKERTHFNAIFQKKYNMSPSEWRKRNGTLH